MPSKSIHSVKMPTIPHTKLTVTEKTANKKNEIKIGRHNDLTQLIGMADL